MTLLHVILGQPAPVGEKLIRFFQVIHRIVSCIPGSSWTGASGAAEAERCEGVTRRSLDSRFQNADRTFRRVNLPLLDLLSVYVHWFSGIFGTVGTLRSPLPLLSSLFFSSPLLLSPPSPTLFSPLLSGGDNFNDFTENQLTVDFAFLCKPAWGNATISPFLRVLMSFRERHFPTIYLREQCSPRLHRYSCLAICLSPVLNLLLDEDCINYYWFVFSTSYYKVP